MANGQIKGLDDNDLLGTWASLGHAIDAKGSKATEKELVVLILLNNALNFMDTVDRNNGDEYAKIAYEKLARQCRQLYNNFKLSHQLALVRTLSLTSSEDRLQSQEEYTTTSLLLHKKGGVGEGRGQSHHDFICA